ADSTGVYLAGATSSVDFPTAMALFPVYQGGAYDAFVTKIALDGTTLLYSTYLGGTDYDHGYGLGVDGAGDAWVTGCTRSARPGNMTFPLVANTNVIGGEFISELDPTGGSLLYSDVYGSPHDCAFSLALSNAVGTKDPSYDVVTAGFCQAQNDAYPFLGHLRVYGPGQVERLGAEVVDTANGPGVFRDIVLDANRNCYVTGARVSHDFVEQYVDELSQTPFVERFDPFGAKVWERPFNNPYPTGTGRSVAVDEELGTVYMTGWE